MDILTEGPGGFLRVIGFVSLATCLRRRDGRDLKSVRTQILRCLYSSIFRERPF